MEILAPNVAPRWSNVAPTRHQCYPNVAPMGPNVATKRWEYPFVGVHQTKVQHSAKTRKTGITNAVGVFAPQCGPNVVQKRVWLNL